MVNVPFDIASVLEKNAAQFKQIRKRDGQFADFDISRVFTAILKAGRASGEIDTDLAGKLTVDALDMIKARLTEDVPSIEMIQDCVEDVLLASQFKKTAKAYILYRDQHARNREMIKKADLDLIDSYLNRLDWKVQENSNMTYSLQGLNNYISSEISKVYWLNKIYTPEIRFAHENGDIHIHDLGLLSVYCVGWDLQDLLRNGFMGVAGKAQSRPAKHFRAALGQIVNFFYTLQGEAAGAQAFSNLDTLLAPFIRYDKLDYEEVEQALQEFIYNVNIPTRVGFQTPFTNVTLDLVPPSTLASQPVIIGGKPMDETYGQFQEEMNMFNKAFLEVLAQGDANGRVFTFPIPTYNISDDFDWDSPQINKLWEVTAKYGIPYFANFMNSDMSPEDARSMCCRLRLDLRHLEKRGGGLFGANPLTGSIGVVTLNLPRLGFVSSDRDEFFKKLDNLIEMAKTSLETKRKLLEEFTDKNLYPYTSFYLRNVKERFGKYWHNHFSTVGIVGMNEACLNLLGEDISTPAGREFSKNVLDYIREKLIELQDETGNMYNLEATPAEGTAYRLAKLDKQEYPNLVCANEAEYKDGANCFYTNSSQLPVNHTDDIFQVLEHQDDLQASYTGGTVLHVFLGESVADPQAVKSFVRKVCQNYRLPYFTISPVFSICPEHGYLHGQHNVCPTCQRTTEVYSRVVGYLRPVNQWNEGKQAEFEMRSKYTIGAVK